MTLRCGCVLLALVLGGTAHAGVVDPTPPELRKATSSVADPAVLQSLAHDTFKRLLPLFPTSGPRPELSVSPTDRVDAWADDRANITVTRGLLKLCAKVTPGRGVLPDQVARTRIAFVLSHELAHVTHNHPGLFGPGVAEAVEERADQDAVGALFVAGFDPDRLQFRPLLRGIARAKRTSDPTVSNRVRRVERRARSARDHAAEWQVGWLLSVSGRFEEAREFYRSFATKYPLPSAMYELAHTRVLAAWRVHPCSDEQVLEWSVPLRYDPRSQVAPFAVRSFQDSCGLFTDEVNQAIEDLGKVPSYAPARIAVGAMRLMLGDPSLDPTSKDGGVTQMGTPCPALASNDAQEALLHADACQISLLSQFEMSRQPWAEQAATDGLRGLLDRWPNEPSLQFNLARLLTRAGRGQEARQLWLAFARNAGQGPYREEAERQARRLAPALDPTPLDATPSIATTSAYSTPSLAVQDLECTPPASGTALSASPQRHLRRCGSWNEELVVRDLRGVLIRSVSASSRFWPATNPPTTTPLFVTANATGDELRVWEEEAWLFDAKTPQRVVYFRKPQ